MDTYPMVRSLRISMICPWSPAVISFPFSQRNLSAFARALGQLHFLAFLGLCIPGTSAGLMLTDRVLTHFSREDGELQKSGRLQDDLQRLHDLPAQAAASW